MPEPKWLGALVPELLPLLLEVEVGVDWVPECWPATTATATPVPATPIAAVATAATVERRIQRALGAFASFGFMPQQSPGPAQADAKGTSSLDQVLLRLS
jgi:hypothetical protein